MYADTILRDLPVGYWRLGEPAGSTTVYDGSGNRFHSQDIYDLVSLGWPGALLGDSNTSCRFFFGAIVVPHDDAFNFGASQDFSIEAWMRWADTLEMSVIGKWFGGSPRYPFLIQAMPDGSVTFFRSDGVHYPSVSSPTPLNNDAWHHIVAVKRGGALELYVDGAIVGTKSDTATGTVTNTDNLYFGRRGNGVAPYAGYLDEVAIYAYALSPQQIAKHYQEAQFPSSPPATPFVRVDIAFASDPLATPPIWTDVSGAVRSFSIRRGRQMELNRIEAGTATIVLDNRDRSFDPTNVANVLPMRRVRIGAIWNGNIYWLFSGFAESWPQRWRPFNDATTELRCVDAFKILSLYQIEGHGVLPELSSDRVHAILDLMVWPPRERAIDTGQSFVAGMTINETALSHLQAVAQAEGGMLFVAADGRITFRNRRANLNTTELITVASKELPFREIVLEYSDAHIKNRVEVTRLGGTTTAIAEDAASQAKYMKRVLSLSNVLLTSDNEAQAMAEWLVARYAEPSMIIRQLQVQPAAEPTRWPAALGRELGDLIVVVFTPPAGGPSITQKSVIEGIAWDVDKNLWRATWTLSQGDKYVFWTLAGSDTDPYAELSRLEQTTRLAY